MVEILLFAILSVYLSYRLWSVLGTRTGHEKQRRWMRPESDDNVIILQSKESAPDTPQEVKEAKEETPEPFEGKIKALQQSLKNFTLERFEKGATNTFSVIIHAFAQGDVRRLEELVAPKVLKGFESAIKARARQKETMNIELKGVEAEIEDIIVKESMAQILVRFTSDQIVTVINKAGEIIENTNLLTNRMIDRWTFEKKLNDKSLVWLLVKTESLA